MQLHLDDLLISAGDFYDILAPGINERLCVAYIAEKLRLIQDPVDGSLIDAVDTQS